MSSYLTDARHNNDRLNAGQWIATSKTIRAQYPAHCAHCRGQISVGQMMRRVYRTGNGRTHLWMHEACAPGLRMPRFYGKG